MSTLHQISGCSNPERKADVIFVHGLGGEAFSTWRHGKDASSSWPHWLGEEFPEVGVWSLGYAASPTRWTRVLGWFSDRWRDAGQSMSLPDRAGQVLGLMVQRGLGERPLLFICHSLGGLLTKQILRKAVDSTDSRRQQVARNTRAVLFLATPHTGNGLASLASAFPSLFGTTVSLKELRADDAHLRDLLDWYRHHAVDLHIETVTYFEQRDVGGVRIVSPSSAHPGIGANPEPLDEDHLSIAKPRERDAQVCDSARDLLRRYVLAPLPALPTQPVSPPALPAPLPQEIVVKIGDKDPHRIPHELPPPAETFFGRPAELKKLTERLRAGKNSAVVGPAGMGKTALAAEAVRAVVGETAASLAASPFPDGVVFLDLYTFRGQAEPTWNALANKLAGAEFLERAPARDRATEACRARRLLVVIEGGEEADGKESRAEIRDVLSVLSLENRRLLLTRLSTQAVPAESVELREALQPQDAADLLDSLTEGRVTGALRDRVLELLEGHPLALTWAGGLLARDDEEAGRLVSDWQSGPLPKLSEPAEANHTLGWLFDRSVRGLDPTENQALAAAGLLARAPFPFTAIAAALDATDAHGEETAREALQSLVRRSLLRRSGGDSWQFTHVLGYRFARQVTGSDPGLRERLALWLRELLETEMAAKPGDEGPVGPIRSLEHTTALLRADADQRLWPLAKYVLYDGYNRLRDLGRLALLDLAIGAVAGWLGRFPQNKAQESYWLREQSSLLDRRGDVLLAQGDLVGALAAYRESLAIKQRLKENDPSNMGWQRDLSVGHSNVGDVLGNQGDLEGALVAYRESLTIFQSLAATDPLGVGWQRDLSVSHNRVGDVLFDQGDLEGALVAHRESLAIIQSLVAIDPSNAGWQHDLGASHDRIGRVLLTQGKLEEALLVAYQDSLAVLQLLTAADPSNAGWQRDLAVSLTRMAQIHERLENRSEALRFAEGSHRITKQLAALDPTNVTWQKDVRVSRALVAHLKG